MMRFDELTYLEIRERAADGWLAVVPTGCTEQQGPHLPVGFDTWFAETVVLEAVEAAGRTSGVRALVLPAAPFGPTPEHRGYGAGFVDIPVDVHTVYVGAVLDSLAEQGFRRVVVWRGCGQHDLRGVVEDFNKKNGGQSKAFLPELPYRDVWLQVGEPERDSGGHADGFATSVALHLRPEMVRSELVADPRSEPVDWQDHDLDLSRYSTTGVIGNPTVATAALGERVWIEVVRVSAAVLKEIAQQPV